MTQPNTASNNIKTFIIGLLLLSVLFIAANACKTLRTQIDSDVVSSILYMPAVLADMM